MPGTTNALIGLYPIGTFLIGDGPTFDYQGDTAGCKPDTYLYVESSDMTDDLSQFDRTLTLDTGAWYVEDNALALQTFTFEVVLGFDTSSSGTIAWISDGGVEEVKLATSTGFLQLDYGAGSVAVSIPSTTGTEASYLVVASVEPNPLTTGASDAILLSLAVGLVGDPDDVSDWAMAQSTTAAVTVVCDEFSIGGEWDGASMSSAFSDTISKFRYSARPHSTAEARCDFIAATTPATVDGELPPQLPRLTDTIGDEGAMAGPAYRMAGAHHLARRMTYMGPAWTWAANTPADLDLDANDLGTEDVAWLYSPADVSMTGHIGMLASPPVPPNATHVLGRVKVSSDAAAAASTSTIVGLVSMNRKPAGFQQLGQQPGAEMQKHWANTTWDHDSQDTDGDWLEIAPVRIAQDADGFTWIWIGLDDQTSGAEIRIEGATVHFVHLDLDDAPPEGLLIP